MITLSVMFGLFCNVGLLLLFWDVKKQNDALVDAINYYQQMIKRLYKNNENIEIR